MPKAGQSPKPPVSGSVKPSQQPPPIEIHGLGTWQRVKDELWYLEQCMERTTHSNHRVEKVVLDLTNEIESLVGVLEEIRDMLKKKLSEDDDG